MVYQLGFPSMNTIKTGNILWTFTTTTLFWNNPKSSSSSQNTINLFSKLFIHLKLNLEGLHALTEAWTEKDPGQLLQLIGYQAKDKCYSHYSHAYQNKPQFKNSSCKTVFLRHLHDSSSFMGWFRQKQQNTGFLEE